MKKQLNTYNCIDFTPQLSVLAAVYPSRSRSPAGLESGTEMKFFGTVNRLHHSAPSQVPDRFIFQVARTRRSRRPTVVAASALGATHVPYWTACYVTPFLALTP